MEEAKSFIKSQGWTPRIVIRHKGEHEYLYAARKINKKLVWCYIARVSTLDVMNEKDIIEKLNKKQPA